MQSSYIWRIKAHEINNNTSWPRQHQIICKMTVVARAMVAKPKEVAAIKRITQFLCLVLCVAYAMPSLCSAVGSATWANETMVQEVAPWAECSFRCRYPFTVGDSPFSRTSGKNMQDRHSANVNGHAHREAAFIFKDLFTFANILWHTGNLFVRKNVSTDCYRKHA